MAFCNRTTLLVTREGQDIPLEVEIETILPDKGLQRLHLCLVTLVAHLLQRFEELSHFIKVLAGNAVDAQVGNAFAVRVVDLLVRKRSVEEADTKLKAYRACKAQM